MDAKVLAALLKNLVGRRFGQGFIVKNIKKPSMLGGANETILFEIDCSGKNQPLVLRRQTYFEEKSPFLSMTDQFKTLKLAFNYMIEAPEPLFMLDREDNLGEGFVMRFVEGETVPKKILSEESFQNARDNLAQQCGEVLAKIHSIPTENFDYLGQTPDSKDVLNAQIQRYDYYGGGHPALDLAIRWLQKNQPAEPYRKFVHGDFRLGNIAVKKDGLKSVLDWECSHLGDPMEDLAWLCLRSWRFGRADKIVGGFGDRNTLYSSYLEKGGCQIIERRIKWWEIFGYLRWAILNMMQAHGHLHTSRRSLPFAICGRNVCLIEYDLLMAMKSERL